MSPTALLFLGAAAVAAWLVLLLLGFAGGGAIHLLGVAGLLLVSGAARRARAGAAT